MPCRILNQGSRRVYAQPETLLREKLNRVPNLRTRAWCFQERVLSPRILIFGQIGMSWLCAKGEADEWAFEGKGVYTKPVESLRTAVNPNKTKEGRKIFESTVQVIEWKSEHNVCDAAAGKDELEALLQTIPNSSEGYSQTLHQLWFGIVSQDSTCQMTQASDKLIALAGLASRVQSHISDQYLAGLWQKSLCFDLMWFSKFDPKASRPARYRAPTWSWASIDGQINSWAYTGYLLEKDSFLCHLIQTDIQAAHAVDVQKLGAISSASLRLTGIIRYLPPDCHQPETDSSRKYIWGKSVLNIHYYDHILGQFRPDTITPDLSAVHLMPIMRATRDDYFRIKKRPAWAILSAATYNRISDMKYTICGLALKKISNEAGCFERIGVFHFDFDSPDRPAAAWFNNLREEQITIY